MPGENRYHVWSADISDLHVDLVTDFVKTMMKGKCFSSRLRKFSDICFNDYTKWRVNYRISRLVLFLFGLVDKAT